MPLLKRSDLRDDFVMATAKKTVVRGRKVPIFWQELVVIRTGRFDAAKKSTKRSEEARFLVKKAGTALTHPGIRKKAVFKPGHTHVFAYSANPRN